MAKYLAVHTLGKDVDFSTPDSLALSKAVKANCTLDAYWVKSWYIRETGILYCEWDAKDADSVRQVFAKAAPDFPIDRINPIELTVHGEEFR